VRPRGRKNTSGGAGEANIREILRQRKDVTVKSDADRVDVDGIASAGPKHIPVWQAARILGVSKNTVLGYIREGRLPTKNIALVGKRATYRLLLDGVQAVRDAVQIARPPSDPRPPEPKRRRVRRTKAGNGDGSKKYRCLNLDIDA
jgi:hypothetical protein